MQLCKCKTRMLSSEYKNLLRKFLKTATECRLIRNLQESTLQSNCEHRQQRACKSEKLLVEFIKLFASRHSFQHLHKSGKIHPVNA
jgi:hypothetical protein